MRQSISLFLAQARAADATAMLLLGQHLGPGARLSALGSRDLVEGWLSRTYTVDSSGYATVHCALEYWHRQGWLPED
ncbi:hypothetical protein ACTXM8_16930 [Brachybacterium alimentarium]|uniref:hypothetical protein n=1 Tax=Brachybacterium alimentarium TaxID=47845 RepID=UPI003FCF3924